METKSNNSKSLVERVMEAGGYDNAWLMTDEGSDAFDQRARARAQERFTAAYWWSMGRADGGASDATLNDPMPFAAMCRAQAYAFGREETYALSSILDQWTEYRGYIDAGRGE
jgi:hypothetical protein